MKGIAAADREFLTKNLLKGMTWGDVVLLRGTRGEAGSRYRLEVKASVSGFFEAQIRPFRCPRNCLFNDLRL